MKIMDKKQAVKAHGQALIKMLESVSVYVDAYQNLYGQDVAQDYVIGAGVEGILREISGKLFNGELGDQDGACLSGLLCGIAKRAGFENF